MKRDGKGPRNLEYSRCLLSPVKLTTCFQGHYQNYKRGKKRPFNYYSSISRVHSGHPYVQERRQELCSGHVINFLLTTTVFKVLFLFGSWGKWVLGPYIYVITKLADSGIWVQIVRTTINVYTRLFSNSGPLQVQSQRESHSHTFCVSSFFSCLRMSVRLMSFSMASTCLFRCFRYIPQARQ